LGFLQRSNRRGRLRITPRGERRLAILAVASVIAVTVLQRFPGELWWPTLALVYSPQQIWIAIPVVAGIFFARRRRWRLASGMAALAIVAIPVLLGFPGIRPEAHSSAELRVLTWNLYYGKAGPSVPELASKLVPDIICLQEADPWAKTHLDDMMRLPQFRGWNKKVCGELVILSRFPLQWERTTHSCLWATVDVNGSKVTIICAHLRTPVSRVAFKQDGIADAYRRADQLRKTQTAQIIDNLPAGHPVILCGDLNTPPNTTVFRTLHSKLTDSFGETGQGYGMTFPSSLPAVRIDHIMLSRGLKPVRSTVVRNQASNHLPLCTDIRIDTQ
jgi:vancomycin resistance protein VanJ